MDVKNFLEEGQDYFVPNLSIDHIVIGYENGILKCLLLELDDKWMLPGGFVRRDESVHQSCSRILEELTALSKTYTKLLDVVGNVERKFTDQWKNFIQKMNISWKDNYWINDRFITVAYYSLVDISQVAPEKTEFHDNIKWVDFNDLPKMWMDHKKIALRAKTQLKEDILKQQISHHLLPPQFTMPELHLLHECILETELDRSRFQKKMLSTQYFERLPKRQQQLPGRNPYVYTISKTSMQ